MNGINLHRVALGVAAGAQFLSQTDGIPHWLNKLAAVLAIGLAVGVNREAVPIMGPAMARRRISRSMGAVEPTPPETALPDEEPTRPGVPPAPGPGRP